MVGGVGSGTPFKDAVLKRSASPVTAVYAVANNAANDLLVYPNPTISTTRIVLPSPSIGVVNVDIIDLNGNVVRTEQFAAGSYNLDVDMSRLPTSVYSVRVSGKGDGFHNLKVMKD